MPVEFSLFPHRQDDFRIARQNVIIFDKWRGRLSALRREVEFS